MERNLLIAVPRGVLHENPAVFRGVVAGETDAVVISEIHDGRIRAELSDIFKPFAGSAFRHIDDAFLAEAVGGPCDAAAVVAVGRRDERQFAELRLDGGAGHAFAGKFTNVHAERLGDIRTDGVAAAEHLESVQTEAFAFILDMNRLDAKQLRELLEFRQRRGGVFGKTLVERHGFLSRFQAETADVIGCPVLFMGQVGGFETFLHFFN